MEILAAGPKRPQLDLQILMLISSNFETKMVEKWSICGPEIHAGNGVPRLTDPYSD